MSTSNPQGTFSIDYEYRDDDSPIELYRVEYWTVRSLRLARDIAIYSSTEIQRADSRQYGDVVGVTFAEDGQALLVRRRDGNHERVPLPVAFRLSDDGTELIHSYGDGSERREALLGKGLAAQLAAQHEWDRRRPGPSDDSTLARFQSSARRQLEWVQRAAREELEHLRARLGTGP